MAASVGGNSPSVAHRPRPFVLALALAAVLLVWSVNYIVGTITLAHLDALTLASFRFQLSAAILGAIYFMQPQTRRAQSLVGDLWTFSYLGFFGFAVNQGCFVLGLSQTTSEHSVVIIATGPVLILLLARPCSSSRSPQEKFSAWRSDFARGCARLLDVHGARKEGCQEV